MPKRQSIEIAGEFFATKRAAEDRCRQVLYGYPLGASIPADDARFLVGLLQRHPSAPQKIGSGIAGFTTGADPYGGRCFFVTRTDGTQTDFSFKHALTAHTPWDDFRAAARRAVAPQVIAFKDAAFGGKATVPCAVTGVLVTRETCHIDHIPPATFESLLQRFLEESGIDWQRVPIAGYGDGEMEHRIDDPTVHAAWVSFHQEHARLRVTSRRANLSDVKKSATMTRQLPPSRGEAAEARCLAREARERARLSLKEAAKKARVSVAYLQRVEKRGAPYNLAVRLAALYGCPLGHFLPTGRRAAR